MRAAYDGPHSCGKGSTDRIEGITFSFPASFLEVQEPSGFRRFRLGAELLARGKPRFQLLISFPAHALQDNSRHALRVYPGHLASRADPRAQRQFEGQVEDRALLERLHRAYGHAAS